MSTDRQVRARRAAAALVLTLLAASGFAADHPELAERLSRIFEKREYEPRTFGPARWLDGGRAYTTVESSASVQDAKEIVSYDTQTGRRRVIVPSSRLVPPGASKPLGIEGYEWSKDAARLLLFTNAKKVWRAKTRGDYWVLDLARGTLRKLGGDAPESSLLFAKFSPDGSRVAYVRANDLWVEDVATGAITRLTSDGSETTINGTTDWVYEEEFHLRDAFRWSPDGRSIAYWQLDTTGVGIFTLIDDTDSLYPTLHRYAYPKVGTKNPSSRVGVVPAAGGPTRWIEVSGDPRENYIPRMEWTGAGTIALQRLNRLQNRNDLCLADTQTGAVRLLFRDESKTWVDINDRIRWLERGRAFLFESERDGWRHVYRVPADGSAPVLVTRFDGDVTRVCAADETGGWLYFLASPEDPTQRHLYRCRLDGSGRPEQITPAKQPGTHAYDVSPDCRWAFHTVSRFDHPPATDLVRLPDHRVRRQLIDNSDVEKKAAPLLASPAEFVRVPVEDGVVLDGWVIKPRGFRPDRKYPLILYVYGEPAGQTVVNSWGGPRGLFHRALADEGYVVASFDNRGTAAPRGAAWRKVIYGAVGVLSSKDQAAAVRAFAASHPWVDTSRVGIWGWSGGGSTTLNAMFRYPAVFKVGVAVASVPDEKLYDTIYQERYMGLPGQNAEGYRAGSPIHFAEGLAGRLLIVHGSGDDNVHYQGAEKLVNRLVELGKRFDLMVYPNRTHAISEGTGTTLHLYTLIARYFLENL